MKTAEEIKTNAEELDSKRIAIGLIIVLLIVSCLLCIIPSIAFVWLNNGIGGLGNPYLFWP